MSILSEGISVCADNWQLITGMLAIIAVVNIPLFSRLKSDRKLAFWSIDIFLALFIILSLVIRQAYVSRALFPSYFDSAQHYAIIKNIMAHDLSQAFESLRVDYYHVGFHFIAAFLASIFKAEITTVMLILGQVILAVLPLPIFAIVKSVTRSDWAGMFAAVLSAFGWYMPAHAVDWGKYPALMSLGVILFVLSLVCLFAQDKDEMEKGKRISFYLVIGFSILITAFVHSRSLIVFGGIAIVWVVSIGWGRLSQKLKHILFFLMLVILLIIIVLIQGTDVLSLLFDPYLNEGIWVTILVAALSIFAYRSYPQLTFVSVMTICLLLLGVYVPVAGLFPSRPYLTLMDRPYVQMILFIPLSLIGGFGVDALEKRIGKTFSNYLALIIMSGIVVHAFANYHFYPSDCCVLVGNDDAAAVAWMADQLPVEARIGVASTELKVVAAIVSEGDVGADAGVWITPLIGRGTIFLPYDFVFDEVESLETLCGQRIEYLFVGELGQTFDAAELDFRPEWYRPLLAMPRTRVYEVTGCD